MGFVGSHFCTLVSLSFLYGVAFDTFQCLVVLSAFWANVARFSLRVTMFQHGRFQLAQTFCFSSFHRECCLPSVAHMTLC